MKKMMIVVLVLLSAVLLAQDTGTISGKVTDKDTGEPLAGSRIILVGTSIGASSDMDGNYQIKDIPVGTYTLKAACMGYVDVRIERVKVKKNKNTKINIHLEAKKIEEEVTVVTPMADQANYMYKLAATSQPRYARGITGEGFTPHNTEEYSRINENTFQDVLQHPLSTFAADVDVASYSNARRFIMQDQMPYKDAVRIEEFINYFDYDYKQPKKDVPLSFNMEYGECPWNKDHNLIHIGLKGKELSKEEQKPSNLIFLIDVSGSMNTPKKLPLLKRSFKLLVEQLTSKDRVAMVVYASRSGLVLPATPGSEKKTIIAALDRLQAGGSTAGGAGIQLAYKVAQENFIKDGNNRVILATDGDFNVGISSTSELVRFIEEKRDDGIFLTILGFGMGNYKDDRLQELADRGNGNHAYIDNILEAKKVLVNEITSTLFTIAKDVKIQVEFNPAKIKSYRLVGYENRQLEDKDFTDDKKDAGEIGAGHTVTVLYEVIPSDSKTLSQPSDLKYQVIQVKKDALQSNEILTLRIRYKEPDGETSKEISDVLKGKPLALKKTSDNFRFSAAVAEFGMLLRESEFKGDASLREALLMAQSAKGKDPFGYRAEFLGLIERVEMLMEKEE